MRLFLLTTLTMLAFAANSLLNRAGLLPGGLSAEAFGVLRLLSGAVMLAGLVILRSGAFHLGGAGRGIGVLSLLTYIFGFSFAYNALDTGVGALILFGMVQVTMFAGSVLLGERPPVLRWLGATVAFGGLVWLLWPGGAIAISPLHGAAMAAAGAGWGVYSLNGRRPGDPMQATAANFAIATLACLPLLAVLPVASDIAQAPLWALSLAVVSGAVTSGLGYALWYSVLPHLQGSVAAVAQLSVPVLAMAAGGVLLGETLSLTFLLATAIVLGGVALSVLSPKT